MSEIYEVVIGVDTHAASHTLSAVDSRTGAVRNEATFPTTQAGLSRAHYWVDRQVLDEAARALVVVEGVGSYGAIFAGLIQRGGYQVVEALTPNRGEQRGSGKTDSLDATRMARAVLSTPLHLLSVPRSDGHRAALRVLVVAREQMSRERARVSNALTALLRTVDLNIDVRRPLSMAQIRTVAALRSRTEDVATSTARTEAIRLARRFLALAEELSQNRASLLELVTQLAPNLLAMPGVGAVVAATVLTTWSHPDRVRSEAALASLAGTCPIPASSGNTVRHRLNRGGDRRLNRALTTIVLVRMGRDAETREYVQRRTTEGKTKKEIMRSLKRYVTRHIYRTLNAADPAPAT